MGTRRVISSALCVCALVGSALIAAGCGAAATTFHGIPVVTVTGGPDSTGTFNKIIADCDKQSKGAYHLRYIVLPNSVDQQRATIVRRLAAKDSTLDILGMDVTWTAEFADAGWIYNLTKRVRPIAKQFLPAGIATVAYDGKYWALPVATNAALLYYRTDLVKKPPATWEQMVADVKAYHKQHPDTAGFLWQANQYEGLSVDTLEFIRGEGGRVVDASGKNSDIDKSDATLKAFQFMQMLFKDNISPRSVSTFMEEDARQLYQAGNALFMRNWPYAYTVMNEPNSKIKGKFAVEALPKFANGQPATILGGMNYGISRYSKHPQLAWQAMRCITSYKHEREAMLKQGNMSVLTKMYSDPKVEKALPYTHVLYEGLQVAHPRPVTAYYNDVSTALYTTAHEVATGHMSPAEGVKQAQKAVQLAAQGDGEV